MKPEYIQSNALLIAVFGATLQLSQSLQNDLNLGNLGVVLIFVAILLNLASVRYY